MSNDLDGIPVGDLERGPSAKFPTLGTSYTGVVTGTPRRIQQRNFDTGDPEVWQDGTPKLMSMIPLQCDDGTSVTLYAKGGTFEPVEGTGTSLEVAIARAARAAGADRILPGARLTVTHSGLTKPAKKGMNPAKLFTATYEPPAAAPPSISVAELYDDDEG